MLEFPANEKGKGKGKGMANRFFGYEPIGLTTEETEKLNEITEFLKVSSQFPGVGQNLEKVIPLAETIVRAERRKIATDNKEIPETDSKKEEDVKSALQALYERTKNRDLEEIFNRYMIYLHDKEVYKRRNS